MDNWLFAARAGTDEWSGQVGGAKLRSGKNNMAMRYK